MRASLSTTTITTAVTAISTTVVSIIPNLLTTAEDESMVARAARIAKFSYAGLRFPNPPFNPLRITNSPSVAENSATLSFESDDPTQAPTSHLPLQTLPLPESASTPAPPPFSFD